MNVPQVVKIKDIIEETPTVKTLIFDWEVTDEVPGQFMMLWNFHDEKPMSLSLIDPVKGEIGFTIRKVQVHQALHDMEVGNQIGLRGPYGRGFEISGSHILAVGGGVGMAPLAAFAEEASRKDVAVDLISAAATEKELLFMNRLNKTKNKYMGLHRRRNLWFLWIWNRTRPEST